MKPCMLLAALAVIMIAWTSVADAQTATPTANPPGITQGPWTSAKPGNSKSQCSPGEYAVGIEVEGAPPPGKTLCRLRFKTPSYLPALRYLAHPTASAAHCTNLGSNAIWQ